MHVCCKDSNKYKPAPGHETLTNKRLHNYCTYTLITHTNPTPQPPPTNPNFTPLQNKYKPQSLNFHPASIGKLWFPGSNTLKFQPLTINPTSGGKLWLKISTRNSFCTWSLVHRHGPTQSLLGFHLVKGLNGFRGFESELQELGLGLSSDVTVLRL